METVLLALALASPVPVEVVPELRLEDAARGAAVGLVVPDAGPRTSRARALASLRCGTVVNSLRDELPSCARPLVEVDGGRIVLELPEGGTQPNDRRYPIAVRGAEGLLTSDATRIPGLVSIAAVGTGRLQTRPHDDPVAYLRALDERIEENGRARMPAFLLGLALLAALAVAWPRAALLGVGSLLAANLALGAAGVSALWAVLLVTTVAVAAGGPLLALAARRPAAVGAVLAAVLAAYLAALGLQGEWVALSPLGPTQNARFFGVSNHLATLLLVPAVAAAALLRRPAAFLGVAAIAIVGVAGSSFGADGGGAIVLLGSFAVLASLLHGAFPGGALVLATLTIAAAAIVWGPETHVTAASGDDIGDRIALSLERLADEPLAAVVAALAVLALAVLALRGPRRALPLAFAAGIAISLVVNDSPLQVALAGLVGTLTLDRYDSPR